jgi:hypothetical protein
MPTQDIYNLIAEDLAYWLDTVSTQLAVAMAPRGIAPFGAVLTEGQKLEYYAAQLFNQDGSPNAQGRTNMLNLLGPKGFADVYHAVTRAYPNLRIPTPPSPEDIANGAANQPVPGQPANPGVGPPPPPQPVGAPGG